MQRNRRTRILVEDQTDLALQLAQEADGLFPVVVREPAHPGLMMTRVRESAQNTLFYLGEVLVTRARVSINEQSGLGLLQGEEREKALALAVIDAAYPLLPDEKKRAGMPCCRLPKNRFSCSRRFDTNRLQERRFPLIRWRSSNDAGT